MKVFARRTLHSRARHGAYAIFAVLLMSACGSPENEPDSMARGRSLLASRCLEIRGAILDNLHRGAHFRKAVDLRTLRTVRRLVNEGDSQCLATLLGDEREPVAVAAGYLLISFGDAGTQRVREIAVAVARPAQLRAQTILIDVQASSDLRQSLLELR